MTWNWQRPDWPDFTHDKTVLEGYEKKFLTLAGEFIGAFRYIGPQDRETLKIELISEEALKTSEIEGEYLNRASLQSSLRNQFGLESDDDRLVPPRERGISEMMVNLYHSFAGSLSHETLFAWHTMVMAGERHVETIGAYRVHEDPMQVVSGYVGNSKVHFEAPPSQRVPAEMDAFVTWFNDTAPQGGHPLPALTRAGTAHLYFESIHPFEDGNGRIGRALSEKALAQNLGQPSLIALAYTIERERRRYYDMLEHSNKDNQITEWLVYFAETIVEAQRNTLRRIDFYIAKARFYERFAGRLNPRQEKTLARMLREGIDGFKGGLSAENYITITKASRATATRDLQELVAKGALTRTGERRYTRYYLNIETRER